MKYKKKPTPQGKANATMRKTIAKQKRKIKFFGFATVLSLAAGITAYMKPNIFKKT